MEFKCKYWRGISKVWKNEPEWNYNASQDFLNYHMLTLAAGIIVTANQGTLWV